MKGPVARLCGVMLLASAPVLASEVFPPTIQSDLGLRNPPDCSLCHFNGVTRLGIVTTPFGKSMRAHGLVANDTVALSRALSAVAAERVDSDADGVSDIDELKAGSDPNVAPPAPTEGGVTGPPPLDPPRYGCGTAPSESVPLWPGGLGGLTWLLGVRTRRRHQTL